MRMEEKSVDVRRFLTNLKFELNILREVKI